MILLPFRNLSFSASLLPPRFRLHSVRQSACVVPIRNATYIALQPLGPVCVCNERSQHRPAEKFAPRSNLRCDRDLAQPPAVEPSRTARVIEASLDSKREISGEEDFGPGAKRNPLVPSVVRNSISGSLKNKDRHYGEPVVRLYEN